MKKNTPKSTWGLGVLMGFLVFVLGWLAISLQLIIALVR